MSLCFWVMIWQLFAYYIFPISENIIFLIFPSLRTTFFYNSRYRRAFISVRSCWMP